MARGTEVIPDEAVDAAWEQARADADGYPYPDREEIRRILESAAPHMFARIIADATRHIQAQALEDAATKLDGTRLLPKPFHVYYPEWLRKRAAQLKETR